MGAAGHDVIQRKGGFAEASASDHNTTFPSQTLIDTEAAFLSTQASYSTRPV